MLYLTLDARQLLQYRDSGRLYRNSGFIHPHRMLNYYVLIVVHKGELYIAQEDRHYIVRPNQFIILFAGMEHYGYAPSLSQISYDWVHFSLPSDTMKFIEAENVQECQRKAMTSLTETYLMPEFGSLAIANRITALFTQLIDASRRYPPQSLLLHYSLSQLILHFSYILLFTPGIDRFPPHIISVIDYISTHYSSPLSVKSIADRFHYNPDYLSTVFKRHTGQTLISYINRMRIEIAKTILYNPEIHIKEIASLCGFSDEKYFMKTFKRYMGITPMEYRKTFSRKRPGH